MKKIVSMCVLLIMVMCCSGCDSDKSIAKRLLEGTINNTIKGEVSKGYVNINGGGDSFWPEHERNELRYDMIQYLQSLYAYDKPDDLYKGTTSSFTDVYAEILSNFEYTMSDLEKVGEGEYKATITYKPFALGDVLDPVAMQFYKDTDEELAEEAERENPSFKIPDIGGSTIDKELFSLLLEETNKFAKDIKYSEEISTDVTITITDSYWSLSSSYYNDFVASIMDLNVEDLEEVEEQLEEVIE